MIKKILVLLFILIQTTLYAQEKFCKLVSIDGDVSENVAQFKFLGCDSLESILWIDIIKGDTMRAKIAYQGKYVHKIWSDKGNLISSYATADIFRHSKSIGIENFTWYERGELNSHSITRGDTSITRYYYENGFLESEHILNGDTLVSNLDYYESGALKKEQIKIGDSYKFGSYFLNGKLKIAGVISLNFQKIDKWQYFDETGNLIYEELWDDGFLVSTTPAH